MASTKLARDPTPTLEPDKPIEIESVTENDKIEINPENQMDDIEDAEEVKGHCFSDDNCSPKNTEEKNAL